MTLISVVFVSYLLLVMIVGVVASRYGRTMQGYFLADRGLGAWVTAISSVASSESGWLVMGLVGMAYTWGAQAAWTVPGVLLGYVCNWYLVAPRLRQHSEALGAITIPDFLEARFGGRWRLIRLLGILIILFCLMFYVAAQFTATGKAFQQAFGQSYGITYSHGVLIGGLITVIYTLIGGFRAVSWTDLAQGLLMVFGLIVLPLVVVTSIGGFGALFQRLQEVPPRVEAVMTVTEGAGVEQISVEEHPVHLTPEVLLQRTGSALEGFEFHLTIAEVDPSAEQGTAVGEASGLSEEATRATEEASDLREETAQANMAPLSRTVMLNGEPIRKSCQLAPGDEISLGEKQICFDKRVEMVGGRKMVDVLGGATGLALLGWVLGLLGIGLGYPGQPHVLARYMAARSRQVLRRGRVIAIVWGCLALYGAVILGLAARLVVPDLVDPEQAYPCLATTHLPPVLGGILLAAIISAMMSTADSQLLVVSSAVARDFIDKMLGLRSRLSAQVVEQRLVWVTRLTVLVIGLVSIGLALAEIRAVFWFVLFAWSGLGAAFGPPILLALFWRGTNAWGALAGMASGIAVTVLWKMVFKELVASATGLSLYELVPAFAISMLATWLVSVVTPRMREIPPGLEGLSDL
ncbi:MAG: sodium/proline symporter [Candidatus Eisenbacteria sp.]|nr:sodium/proline symporter [Candidatus Eisenbacteria bacterium]